MNWGKSIILAFVLFAVFIGVLVTICVRQDVSLVSKEYYKDELAFQKQIEREQNTEALVTKPVIEVTNDHSVTIRNLDLQRIENGKLEVYSPGDAKQDQRVSIAQSEGAALYLPIKKLSKGKYLVKLNWTVQGKEYYVEQTVIL